MVEIISAIIGAITALRSEKAHDFNRGMKAMISFKNLRARTRQRYECMV
ncbi:hypothetical protein ACY2DA_01130 [Staphylococcus simulans]